MKMNMYVEMKVYRKQEPKAYKLDNGTQGNSYSCTCDDGVNVFDIKFSEEAYNAVYNGDICVFELQYTNAYGRQDLKVANLIKIINDESKLGIYISELVRSDHQQTEKPKAKAN